MASDHQQLRHIVAGNPAYRPWTPEDHPLTGAASVVARPLRLGGRQNIVLSLAEVSGTSCMASQCSTIFPSWKRKRSKTATPAVAGTRSARSPSDSTPNIVVLGVRKLLSHGGRMPPWPRGSWERAGCDG